MEDRLKFINNGMKSATEAYAKNFRMMDSFINTVDMPENVKEELKAIMQDLNNGLSQRSSVKIQAAKDRLKPLLNTYEKIIAAEKVKNSYKLG